MSDSTHLQILINFGINVDYTLDLHIGIYSGYHRVASGIYCYKN